MKSLAGTKTEENLKKAFAGESQACVKYQFYAKQARKDGYQQIADIFEETSANERTHAKIWFKQLHDGGVPDTETNLKTAESEEEYEWKDMYREFAKVAKDEGFAEIARLFESVGKIERTHKERYGKLSDDIKKGIVFSRDDDSVWQCLECGHIHIGKKAPKECPVCSHPQAYFKLRDD